MEIAIQGITFCQKDFYGTTVADLKAYFFFNKIYFHAFLITVV